MNPFRNPKRFRLFAMLAALLGITAGCKNNGRSDDVICMYGVPTVSYELKGKVTDQAGNPVKDIEVTVARVFPSDSAFVGNPFGPTAVTNDDGLWSIRCQDDPTPILKVTYSDIDGPLNGGQFAQDSVIIKDIEPVKTLQDNNPFNLGEVKLELPEAKLKKED